MSDIAVVFDPTADIPFDIALDGADLQLDGGLKTAIAISLFSDARAADDDALPQDGIDRRGWWADAYAEIPGDVVGSKLWLLSREKQLPPVLVRAQGYAQDALAWVIDDGVASAVDVACSFPSLGWLGIEVTLTRPSGPARQKFDFLWKMS